MTNEERATTLNELLLRTAHLKDKAVTADEAFRESQDELIAMMEESNVDQVIAVANKASLCTGSLVKSSSLVIDELGLKKSLGVKLWNKTTKRVLDKTKLEALVLTGEISPYVVAKHSTDKPRSPYVRITRKKK